MKSPSRARFARMASSVGAVRFLPSCREATRRLYADDVSLHGPERRQQLGLFLLTHIVLVETLRQIFDERIDLGLGDLHACVRIAHALARVGARAAGCLAYVIDE